MTLNIVYDKGHYTEYNSDQRIRNLRHIIANSRHATFIDLRFKFVPYNF